MANGSKAKLFMGIDVGGTKILAALTKRSGQIVGRKRRKTPRDATTDEVFAAIAGVIADLLETQKVRKGQLQGIGLAVPGVVDDAKGKVLVAPNVNLAGLKLAGPLEKQFSTKVALGNDVDLGTLGETWLGAGKQADPVVGIFPGTGIGGGIVIGGKLHRGHWGAAAEIGHMVMQIGGPQCGCGNYGCLEALASRTAIERDIRAAVDAGAKTALTDILDNDLSQIRSGALKKALAREDPLVTSVLRRVGEVLGHACVNVRHLLDPEVIVLGGGVMEACGKFLLPIITKIVEWDPLNSRHDSNVVLSELGDDAVVLGAVALAQQLKIKN
jgi:glucokinase